MINVQGELVVHVPRLQGARQARVLRRRTPTRQRVRADADCARRRSPSLFIVIAIILSFYGGRTPVESLETLLLFILNTREL